MKRSLYADLLAANVQIDSHESDLYFELTDTSRAILAKHPAQKRLARAFSDRRTGARWVDVPFAYDPWWAKRARP